MDGDEGSLSGVRLEDFDDLFVGDPVTIESNLRALIPEAEAREDPSLYLQILSQIALAQAMQKHFDAAHRTLDTAESLLTADGHVARARVLLERGRVWWQSGDTAAAGPLFRQSYEICAAHGLDEHACNAAHMIAIVAEDTQEKIAWNRRAIELAEQSSQPRARAWLGSLHHNLGQAYLDARQFDDALRVFQKTLEFREAEGSAANIRVARWAIARAMRCTGRLEQALSILSALFAEYEHQVASGQRDMPDSMLRVARGLVAEELAEVHAAETRRFAALAYGDLAQDEWFQRLEPARLERLRQLSE